MQHEMQHVGLTIACLIAFIDGALKFKSLNPRQIKNAVTKAKTLGYRFFFNFSGTTYCVKITTFYP